MASYKPVVLCFAAFAALLQLSYGSTPPAGHTLGQPWPKPANMTQTADVQALSMDTFQFVVTGNNCDLLRGALNRYFKIIFYTGRDGQDSTLRFRPRPSYGANLLPSLSVNVKSACMDTADKRMMPSLDMDESCEFQQLSCMDSCRFIPVCMHPPAPFKSDNSCFLPSGLRAGGILLYRAGGCQTLRNAYLWNHWTDFLPPMFCAIV